MFTITTDNSNQDLLPGETPEQALDRYLAMREGFVSRLTPPVTTRHGDKWVFRGDLSATSLKGYAAEQLVADTKGKTLVYVAPRTGMAPNAIASLAEIYGNECVFFSPACKTLSTTQRALLYHGADLRFVRVVRMPPLNKFAESWANAFDAVYLPPGLSHTPSVTAGLVAVARQMSEVMGHDPTEVWMSVSTGTAIRAFQIAWPQAKCFGLAVARNLQPGEIGAARIRSSELPFLRAVHKSEWPPFDSTANYDAKCWRAFEEFAAPGSVFINVGCDSMIQSKADSVHDLLVDSWRDWKDYRDLLRGL
jgi:hypothetical protein